MTDPAYLQYLNVQYWYCVFYSIFGGKCTPVDSATLNVQAELSATSTNMQVPTGKIGFWQWLFGGGQGSDVVTNAPIVHTGLFGPLADAVFFVGGLIGAVVSFLWSLYSALAYSLSGILFLALIGLLAYLFFLRLGEAELYGTLPPAETTIHPLRERWELLLDGARSNDPKRWREGIVEADTMLGELFGKLGYIGNSTSEQILLVSETAFVTLPFAWEAHRIRNFVVAPSSSYILTQSEAFRVMKLYEQVFQEFNFI